MNGTMTSEYIPTKELMKRNGLKMDTVMRRLGRGWDFERAISTPIISKNTYGKPLRIIAEENGMNYDTLRFRIYRRRMSLEDAISTPIKQRSLNAQKYSFKIKDLATETGLPDRTIYARLENGWTIEEIKNTPKYKKRRTQ